MKFFQSSLFLKIIFVLSIAVIIFISAISFRHLNNVANINADLKHSYEVSIQLEEIYASLKDLEIDRRNFHLTQDSSHLVIVRKEQELIKSKFNNFRKLQENNPLQLKRADELKSLIDQNFAIIENAILLKKNFDDFEDMRANFLWGHSVMLKIDQKIENIKQEEFRLLKIKESQNETIGSYAPLLNYAMLSFMSVIIILAFTKIFGDINRLNKSNNKLMLADEASKNAEILGNFGTWELNIDRNEYTFSDNEYRLLGYEPQSFKATLERFMEHVHPDDYDYVMNIASNMTMNEVLEPFYYRIIKKDGSIRNFRGAGIMTTNLSEEKVILGTTADVTDEITYQSKIEERNRMLEVSNKELQAFNYVASHDLQEPLRKIETFISILEDREKNNLSETGRTYMGRIHFAAGRMRILINDLLQFSRTNKSEQKFESADLSTLLDNAIQENSRTIEESKAEIETVELPTLMVIPFQIQQLFTNLISNSIKYSKENTAPRIVVSYTTILADEEPKIPKNTKDRFHKISFTDNGIGFEKVYAEKIFELFSRLHGKNEYAGTGIGLAICKKIVENHKGYIFADSQPGVGSTFVIFLPEIV